MIEWIVCDERQKTSETKRGNKILDMDRLLFESGKNTTWKNYCGIKRKKWKNDTENRRIVGKESTTLLLKSRRNSKRYMGTE